MSVNPSGPRVEARFKAADFIRLLSSKMSRTLSFRDGRKLVTAVFVFEVFANNPLLHRNRGHRSRHRYGLHGWIAGSTFRDREGRLPCSLGHERKSDYRALSGNARRSRRPRRIDLERARGSSRCANATG